MHDIDMDIICEFLLKNAEEMRYNASMGGEYGDGGASKLENQVDVYKAGLNGDFPEVWERYLDEYTKNSDKDYALYLRLKEKFE